MGIFFDYGVDFLIANTEMLADEFECIAKNFVKEHGEEAFSFFLKGISFAFSIYTEGVKFINNNPNASSEDINNAATKIEKRYGKELVPAFLKGIENTNNKHHSK